MNEKKIERTENNKVSVVMPLYNASNTCKESIESVLKQSYTNLELIVVDDCSQDNGAKIVENITRIDQRVKLIRLNTNVGAGIARNKAIEAASGRYIAFLDADDQWREDKLEIQISTFRKFNVALICSGYTIVNQSYEYKGFKRPHEWIKYSDMLKSNHIGCLTAIYDTTSIGKNYMPTIRKRQDYALWLNIIKKSGPAYCIQQELSQYYIQSNSISSNKISMLKWNYKMFRETQGFTAFEAMKLTLGNAMHKLIGG